MPFLFSLIIYNIEADNVNHVRTSEIRSKVKKELGTYVTITWILIIPYFAPDVYPTEGMQT